jgi:hypothetical protein
MQVKTWVHWKCMDEWLAFSNLLLLLTLVNKSFTLPQLLLVILYITNISINKHGKHTITNHQTISLKQLSSFSYLGMFELVEEV